MQEQNLLAIVQAFAALVSAVFSGFLLWQIYLTRKQMDQTDKLHRIEAAFSYVTGEYFERIYDEAWKLLKVNGIDLKMETRPLTKEEVEQIKQSDPLFSKCMQFLGVLETIAIGINHSTMDDAICYKLFSEYFTEWSICFGPFIDDLIAREDDEELFEELRAVAKRWDKQYERDKARRLMARNAKTFIPSRIAYVLPESKPGWLKRRFRRWTTE